MNGQVFTNSGNKLLLNRGYKATPDYTAPSVFKVGTGTTTPAASQTDLATAIQIAGVDTKAFFTGYPILEETNFTATIRGILLTTECNANTITEFGCFNTDATPLMSSRGVFTGVAKTSTVQIIFMERDGLT